MTADPPRSTLKRPPTALLTRFHVGQIGEDVIHSYLQKGFSLAICCRDCPRLVEWTPPELEARFGDKLELRIGDLALRLSCTGGGGCGSHDVAVFPHHYDQPWRWTPPKG